MNKRALITGVTGQDGSYLAELLYSKGYEVHGLRRRSSTFGTERIEHLIFGEEPKLQLHYGDLSDGNGLMRLSWWVNLSRLLGTLKRHRSAVKSVGSSKVV